MSALLLKDWYTLIKQMKLMLLVLLIFACVPGSSMAPFAVLYASMLPMTALAYDERSKWDELAVMMPYSAVDIVLGKYILGLASVAAATGISAGAQALQGAAGGAGFAFAELAGLLLLACLSLILLALNMPLLFRLGTERGRIAFLLITCGGAVAGMALQDRLLETIGKLSTAALPLLGGAMLLTAAIFAISVPLSVALYKKGREK